MRRLSGPTILFSLAIMAILVYTACDEEKKETKHIDDAKTTVSQPTPTEMHIKKLAHITLGEQRESIIAKYPEYKVSKYSRDIFINYPTEMILRGFTFRGLHPLTTLKKNAINNILVDEIQNLDLAMEYGVFVQNSDNLGLPAKNSVYIESGFFLGRDDEFVLDLSIKNETAKFNSKEKNKFIINIKFSCTEMMVKRKAIYKLALDAINLSDQHDLSLPVNDFFVINCGK